MFLKENMPFLLSTCLVHGIFKICETYFYMSLASFLRNIVQKIGILGECVRGSICADQFCFNFLALASWFE
jgi:hypothetical protein